MAPSRLTRPGWLILGVAGLVLLLFVGVPRAVRRMDFFRVSKVDVRGLANLRAADVVRVLPIPKGMNLFDDLDRVQRAADSIPGLADVVVSRRLPGTLVVTVREAPPVALVMRKGQLRLLGEDARVLPFDPTVSAPDLPIVKEADSLVTRLLARVREVDVTLFSNVVTGWRAGDDVVLAVKGQRYWFRPDAPAEVIRAVTLVAQDLDRKGRPYADLDARFAGQVVVRWGAA
ncbi:MAG: FtsQ-type POTRA domain-containing protein [Gemmatimonadales bacterium]